MSTNTLSETVVVAEHPVTLRMVVSDETYAAIGGGIESLIKDMGAENFILRMLNVCLEMGNEGSSWAQLVVVTPES